MKLKVSLSLIVSLLLTSGVVLAQQGTPPPAPPAPAPAAPPDFGELHRNFAFAFSGGSFLGVHAEDINNENMGRYGLREARGVGITQIVKDSPAEKAGLRTGDVIVRFDNENVTSARKLTRLVSEVAPDQNVRLTISRGGSEQQVTVTIGKRSEFATPRVGVFREGLFEGMAPGEFVWAFGGSRRIGVNTTQLTKQLGEYFGVADGKGVLITNVMEDGPAAKGGIRAGDVITAVDGEKIETAGELTRALNKKKEGDITLTVIRNKSQMNFTVSPTSTRPLITPKPSGQSARRVVIPRIELPVIPEINIEIPAIDLGVTPEIDIVLPPKPRVRVGSVSQPI